MKTYNVEYRKRGLPEKETQVLTIEAESFAGAKYLASQKIGEDYVIVSAKTQWDKEEEEN